MKKLMFAAFIALLAMTSCGEKELTPEEKVRGFAEYFIEKARLNQIDSLQSFYPDIVKANGLVSLVGDSISVSQTTPDNFEVTIDEKVTLKVVADANGKYGVTESHGLFVVPYDELQMAQRKGAWHPEITDAELVDKIAALLAERRNFTSPDLEFNNLHGPVKTVEISNSVRRETFDGYWLWTGTYKFDEEGKWTNPRDIVPHGYVIRRNKVGAIINIGEPCEPGDLCSDISYTWKDNKVDGFVFGGEGMKEFKIFYSKGFISGAEMRGYSNGETEYKTTIKISDFSTDELGNWTKCVYHIESFQKILGIDSDWRKTDSDSIEIYREIVYY